MIVEMYPPWGKVSHDVQSCWVSGSGTEKPEQGFTDLTHQRNYNPTKMHSAACGAPVVPHRLVRGPHRLVRGPVVPHRLVLGPVVPHRLVRGPVVPHRLVRGPHRLVRGPHRLVRGPAAGGTLGEQREPWLWGAWLWFARGSENACLSKNSSGTTTLAVNGCFTYPLIMSFSM